MNALEFLRKQHEEIRMFCAKLRELRNVEARRRTVSGLARLVRSHASLEEEYLYPKLENEPEIGELVDGAYRDHEHLDEVVADLESCAPDDPALAGIVEELEELFEEHVAVEEGRLFAWIEPAWAATVLGELGTAMQARFAELTQSAERPAIDPDQLPEA
jgi:hemerythrin superfamily protein